MLYVAGYSSSVFLQKGGNMRIVLFLLSMGFLVVSLGSCAMAKGAAQEIEGLILMLCAVVCFVGAALVEALNKKA